MSHTILIPLHYNQYKAIQNIHKGRDVRADIPAEERDEYSALRDNLDIIYEYVVNKNPEQYPDGTELIFEERLSLRDTTGTGKILGKRNLMTTNYLGEKARIKPSGKQPEKEPEPEEEEEEEEADYPTLLKTFTDEHDPPNIKEYYWYDSFKRTYADKIDVVPAQLPHSDEFEYVMAVLEKGQQELDYRLFPPEKNARPVYHISEEYSDVYKIEDREQRVMAYIDGKPFTSSWITPYVYDYQTKSIIKLSEYNERVNKISKEQQQLFEAEETRIKAEYRSTYLGIPLDNDELEHLRILLFEQKEGKELDDYELEKIKRYKEKYKVLGLKDLERFPHTPYNELEEWQKNILKSVGKTVSENGNVEFLLTPEQKRHRELEAKRREARMEAEKKRNLKVSISGVEPVPILK